MINRDIFSIVFVGLLIGVVISGTKMPYYGDVYDKKFIPVMNKLSSLVPKNETLVSSHNFGNMYYFMNRSFHFPHGVDSNLSLLYYMVQRNFTYLLVFENFSRVEDVKDLFTMTGLKNLKDLFIEIGDFTTDEYRYHLYRIKNNYTF